jgi:hypothetical protein
MTALLDKSDLVLLLRKRQNHTATGTRLSMRFLELAGRKPIVAGKQPTHKNRSSLYHTQSSAHQGSAEV